MRRLPRGALFACLLIVSACSPKREISSSQPPPPPPPAALLVPCTPSPWPETETGAWSAANAELVIGLLLVDLKDCDARRKAGADAWPKPVEADPER